MRSRKNKTIKAYEKVLKRDKDWDFSYLYELERLKLKRMFNYFSESGGIYCNPEISNQISICIRLLDIILEKDPITSKYLDEYNYRPYPKYVNWKNEERFNLGRKTPIKEKLLESEKNLKSINVQFLLEDLRKKKAISLYHKIRIRFTDSWWD